MSSMTQWTFWLIIFIASQLNHFSNIPDMSEVVTYDLCEWKVLLVQTNHLVLTQDVIIFTFSESNIDSSKEKLKSFDSLQ